MNSSDEGSGISDVRWIRKTFSLPTTLAEWVDQRAARGEASSYVAGLIEADRNRQAARVELRHFGYEGDLEITEAGRSRARELLDRQAASRSRRARGSTAA